ncbi:MAG: histidinol dehydrogenase [Omnitrophica WOR_2 bacterium RIFCSPHIGHO2_02_FULL_50_17]|nr:MAG: histidinol dehydrogenase [Omnitrophica WOR_2 bacterium RIFCSPHIGHO2_02_FULL_50_17]
MKILTQNGQGIERLYNRHLAFRKKNIEEKVRRIVEDVRLYGDDALIKYTRKFDKAKLAPRQLRVAENEISGAFQNITSDFISDLKVIINNITLFYKKQIQRGCRVRDNDGVLLKENILPLDTVGIYIPAGTAPLISTVYMTAVPARVAGVKRIVLATPPDKDGHVNPYILAVANLLKVNEIYKIGGAQAIAAMAFGTKTVPRVDKIIGPGNMYVTEAKRQIFGYVDIDMLAGPTELVIIANRYSDPNYVAADLEAQLEHAGGLAVLVTTSKQLIRHLRNKISKGYIIYVKNMDEAAYIVNKIAPEHLEILTNHPASIAKKIRNAAAIFLGPYSPTALGDFAAGPSHALPTMGTARFFSGLCLSDFVKKNHIISYSKKALEKMKRPIEQVAKLEGLPKHYESVSVRFT